ncbi:MAG: type II secretion system protein GspH [Gammaproteobacteria bacterium]|nr:type II secretion system protein GspH [Gammaproteobacteria bacterium]
MLIVLAIAGIVMGTLVPSFGPAIARAQLYSASRDVASALRYTRGHAMIRGEDALFELNTIHHTYRVSGRPKLYHLPPGIELGLFTTSTETLDEGTGRIRFFPDGSATGGRVQICRAISSARVIKSACGTISLIKPIRRASGASKGRSVSRIFIASM